MSETPDESGAGYPEETPEEVDDTAERGRGPDPTGDEDEGAPDNEDGTATGNPRSAG